MFSLSSPVASQPSSSDILWTNMESNKVMCPTFSVMLVRTIKALCEINIRFDHKLEISGSLHVRSDGDKVMTCLIDEESIKGAQDLSILDAVRFTMPYAAAALAPMAIPGGFQGVPSLPDALLSPQAQTQAAMLTPNDRDSKHLATNGQRQENREQPHVVNIVPTESQRIDLVGSQPVDAAEVPLLSNRVNESHLPDTDQELLLHRRLSSDTISRPVEDGDAANTPSHRFDISKNVVNKCGMKNRTGQASVGLGSHVSTLPVHPSATAPTNTVTSDQPITSTSQQNHIKLPNIQTFAGMLPRLPQVKSESKDIEATLGRSTEMGSFHSPQNLTSASSPLPTNYAVDPLVGVKIEVQSQVDAEGNVVQKKKFQCMFCGIFLSTKCYLKNHINAMHTKARVYPCEVCEKYFYSAGALRIHKLRNHWHGSKKHKCDQCGETFLLPIELRKHVMKKHADIEEHFEPGASASYPEATADHTTPSSGSNSPRLLAEKYPASLPSTVSHVPMMHGTPVFPSPVPHTTASNQMDMADTDTAITSSPVFPRPILQALDSSKASAIPVTDQPQ